MIVQIVAGAIADGGVAGAVYLGDFLAVIGGVEGGDGGEEGGGVAGFPAFLGERGGVFGLAARGGDEAGAVQNAGEVAGLVDADGEFLAEFDGLAGEGEFDGIAGLAREPFDGGKGGVLRGGESAGLCRAALLPGFEAGDVAVQGAGLGDIAGFEAGVDFGVGLGGVEDGVAVLQKNGDGEVEF